jgi:hypothetical protein
MGTLDIIQQIKLLPLTQKFHVVEQTLRAIQKEEIDMQMEIAAKTLYEDYTNDKELIVFTSLDFENFYETK